MSIKIATIRIVCLFCLIIAFKAVPASADLNEMLKSTKELGSKSYEKIKEYTGKAVDAGKDMMAPDEEPSAQKKMAQSDDNLDQIWGEALSKLEKALLAIDQAEKAPESAWLQKDKESYRSDFNDILEDLISLFMADHQLRSAVEHIDDLKKRIQAEKDDITKYEESRISAPESHTFKDTKNDLDVKIDSAKQAITKHEAKLDEIRREFRVSLEKVGISLTDDKVKALMSRVDSKDIIQMAAIFDIAKKITMQLGILIEKSSDNISSSKKYYGMHLVLSEMIVYMQDSYIYSVVEDYIPQLEKIVENIAATSRETRILREQTNDSHKKILYDNNLKSQHLTLQTAKLYTDNLKIQVKKVEAARKQAMGDLHLAQNTYKTVQISADLLSLIQSSQNSFQALMNLQLPEIIPFANNEVQKEFERLTSKLSEIN